MRCFFDVLHIYVYTTYFQFISSEITKDYFPIPEIYLHSLDQFGNGTFLFDVSCSMSNTTPHLLALSLGCDHKAKIYRPAVVRLSSITVSSENNSTDCSCTATYQMGIHLYNRNVRKVLFADNVYPRPEISLHNFEQDVNGTFFFHVSCMASKVPHPPMSLSLSCSHITKIDRPTNSVIISMTVTSNNNSTDCYCTATYDGVPHLYNIMVHKVLFADNVISQQIFYATSVSENGTNIIVLENQSVTFVCLTYHWKNDSLRLHKGTHLIENAFLNFSHIYTIDRVKCNDSGEYRCMTTNSKGTNLSSVILSVQCDTYNCTDTEECRLNGSVYTSSCWNTTRSSQRCPVPCISCHIDLPDTNSDDENKQLTTFSIHIIIIVLSVTGAVVVSGLIITFFLMKARDQRIERHFEISPTPGMHWPINPRNSILRQNDSIGNGHSETRENYPPSFHDGERSDFVNPIYVPWNPSCDVGTSLTLTINNDIKMSPSEAHT